MSRKTIRLPINTIRTPLSQHHFSSGYQSCAARLTSPRGLFLACESKTQARTRKKKASVKQKRAAQKKSEVWLSDFTKSANLFDFTTAETGPIWLVRFVRFYQACELIRFYQS
jgi:hypothetical protein